MPTEQLKSWAKEAGTTTAKAEKAWEEARTQADKKFKGKIDSHYWSYVNTVTRMKLGLEQKKREEEKKKKADKKKETTKKKK